MYLPKRTQNPEERLLRQVLANGLQFRAEIEGGLREIKLPPGVARSPYVPERHPEDREYWALPGDERAKVAAIVSRNFKQATGIVRKLDPRDPKDESWIRIWLTLRNIVMRVRAEQTTPTTLVWPTTPLPPSEFHPFQKAIGGLTNRSRRIGETSHELELNPNPDHMPTNPLPPGIVPPVPMPTNPLVPKKWCPQLRKIQSKTCFSYAPQEISISHTAAGHVTPDVVLIQPAAPLRNTIVSCGYLIIRDFGVDWRHVKPTAMHEQLFKDWLIRFETDKSIFFRIVGYSDCVGVERHNLRLRRARALNVRKLLGSSAHSRVMAVIAAPSQTYLTDNSTIAARANNRSVVIEFFPNSSQII